jgi:hypothetical protein
MSDYFLNKVYDSLLVNKAPKTKSTFLTLSESYSLVCEEEANPAQVSQNQTENQTSQTQQLEQPKKPLIDVTKPIYPRNEWDDIQSKLYSVRPEGVGPGECSVASLISGRTTPEECKELISGPGASFDVSFPSRETPTYKFEVKGLERGSVRIAKHGTKVKNSIVKQVTDILNDILNAYSVLDQDQQQIVNEYILSYVEDSSLNPPLTKEEEELYQNLKKKTAASGNRRSKEEQEQFNKLSERRRIAATPGQMASATEIESLKGIWTVDRWAQGILNDVGEIPFKNVLFDPSPGPGQKYPEIRRVGHLDEIGTENEETRLIFTVKQFIDFIDKVELQEKEVIEPEEAQTKINTLSKTFKQFYGRESSPELNKKLDDEAIKVDRYLNKIKIDTLKTDYADFAHFVRDIKKLNLKNRISQLENYIYNTPSTVRELFPKEVTGLFVVSEDGYHYFPMAVISNYIKIDVISQDGIKIKLKSPGE